MDMEIKAPAHRDNEERVAEEYLSSLSDLNYNSKPLINVLTILAEENIECAAVIVKVVEQHIAKVPTDFKLPILYLIDSIIKNVKGTYIQLFSQCIVNIFCGVFEKVNEKVRERMYALRQTWNDVFPSQKLYALDIKVKRIDNNWPITAKPPQPSIHVNPNFLKTVNIQVNTNQQIPGDMEEILHVKTRELLELKKRKLELELEATKKHLEEQEKQLTKATESVMSAAVEPLLPRTAANRQARETTDQLTLPQNIYSNDLNSQISEIKSESSQNSTPTGNYERNSRNPPTQMQSTGIVTNPSQGYAHKLKVNPVNPALLNSMRDPRLARHQHQHKSNQSAQNANINSPQQANTFDAEGTNKASVGFNNNNNSNNSNNNNNNRNNRGASTKSSSQRSTSHRSSERSSHKSSSTYGKKDRKRSDSKSSISSPSTGSSSSIERSRGSTATTSHTKQNTNTFDKDDFEIATLSTLKRTSSSSPAASPSKEKRFSKARKYKREENDVNDLQLNIKSDLDLRPNCATNITRREDNADSDYEKDEIKPFNATKDFVKKHLLTVGAKKNVDKLVVTKEQAKSNHCDTDVASPSKNSSIDGLHKTKPTTNSSANLCENNDNDGKKRPSMNSQEDGPLAKKSKATAAATAVASKLDPLFGSTDVDLRTVIPAQLIAEHKKNTSSAKTATPPPSTISTKLDNDQQNLENWDKVKTGKTEPTTVNKASPKKTSTLDDVRAKLAKAAKYNKISKFDKSNRELRFKLTELNMNEDTQEANDEKIRTIVVQAQELLDTDSINQEQYKNLMQTVMSINEANKLREAKRRESLNAPPFKLNQQEDEILVDAERLSAREAVLKKRIPKKPKIQHSNVDDKSSPNAANSSESTTTIKEDKVVDSSTGSNVDIKFSAVMDKRTKLMPRAQRSDDTAAHLRDHSVAFSTQRPCDVNVNFHGNVPHPPMPPLNSHLHLPHVPWHMGNAIPPAAHFGNNVLPMHGNVPPPPQPPNSLALPLMPVAPVIPKPCNSIDNPQADLVRTITIDGLSKEIRIYDQVAIVFMELDQPREIGFQTGQRAIIIDNQNPLTLRFNDDYKTVIIDGMSHQIRFGFPSRELYIDDQWYEIYFGGPPVSIPIQNKMHIIKAEGPPPQVNIGPLRRDLVVGKINMIVDALIIVPLFLDARKQSFFLGDKQHTIQFADNLITVLLDGEAIKVDYGGLPKSYILRGRKYFIRFGALPQGVVPGKVIIKDMVYVKTTPPTDFNTADIKFQPMLTLETDAKQIAEISADQSIKFEPKIEPVETLANVAGNEPTAAAAFSNINIDDLLQKLVSSGILGPSASVGTSNNKTATVVNPGSTTDPRKASTIDAIVYEPIVPIDLSKTDTIKTRQNSIVSTLFSGMQCSSCGVRFPPEQTIKYSQHLDWHFRRNRRERDSSRKSLSRKWYFELADWLQYEEFEDIEEREKNFFESQSNDMEGSNDDAPIQRSSNSPVPSCAALPEDANRACAMCQEKFEQYYNEEFEEWHLRSAIRVDDNIYHPLCYEDYMVSLNPPKVAEPVVQAEEDNAEVIIKIEGDDTIAEENPSVTIADDDDDVIVLPDVVPSITEIDDDDPVDDSEYVPTSITRSETTDDNPRMNDTTESDVEIQEPYIPFTDLDAYEETKSSEADETSQMSFMNVKIKEEPKEDGEDDDEDDGFEDVGTVVLITPDDEISMQSRDEMHTQSLDSASSATSLTPEVAATVTQKKSLSPEPTDETIDDYVSNDDQLEETQDTQNLSTADPTPTLPLGGLVNKIKINITKNIVSTSSNNSSSSSASAQKTTNSVSDNRSVSGQCTMSSNNNNVVSSIPVLCGGETQSNANTFVSSIEVIGSYGGKQQQQQPQQQQQQPSIAARNQSNILPASTTRQTSPNAHTSPAEESISYTFKPALQKVDLKKKQPIESGIETSGLCSIM